MKTSEVGLNLIKRFEQCRLKAFKPTPHDVWTIGWGHTKGVREGDACTQAEADAYLVADIAIVEECIDERAEVELKQNQFDALASFTYNLGCTAFKTSTLLKLLNAGDYNGARLQFQRWNRQGDQILEGLTKRRQAEAHLFEGDS